MMMRKLNQYNYKNTITLFDRLLIRFYNFCYSFSDMTAFSPPSENWLVRYPKKERQEESKKITKIQKIIPKENQLEDPCKKYIQSSEITVKSNKSLGTDDHFRSAVCSKNLLKVCEKLMINKEPTSSASIDSESFTDDDFDAELSLMNEKSRMEFYRNKYGSRRPSSSLPASPKMERKNNQEVSHNPYFTVTKPEMRQESSISFLTNLFGITAKNPTDAHANLLQKFEIDKESRKKTDLQIADGGEYSNQQQSGNRQMVPKPHSYREMNIFSPTSM